jgi:copper oxidase (laccase) domain-containing protein
VLEAAIARAAGEFGSRPADLYLHFGPAICGKCYEVGPEVFEALRWPGPGGKGRVDLAGVLEARALERGVRPERITRSAFCTRCDRDRFYSYRGEGARAGRMAAVAGLLAPGR